MNVLGLTAAPDMARAGFALVGGRLLPDAGKPAAQFMYKDQKGRRVTLYVRSDDGADTAFKFAAEDGISAFYWIDGALATDVKNRRSTLESENERVPPRNVFVIELERSGLMAPNQYRSLT